MESLETIQQELKKAKDQKKEEDASKLNGSVFDHTASGLIQPALGSVLVQHESPKPVEKVQVLTT